MPELPEVQPNVAPGLDRAAAPTPNLATPVAPQGSGSELGIFTARTNPPASPPGTSAADRAQYDRVRTAITGSIPSSPGQRELILRVNPSIEQLGGFTREVHQGTGGYVGVRYNDKWVYDYRAGLVTGKVLRRDILEGTCNHKTSDCYGRVFESYEPKDFAIFGYWLQEDKWKNGEAFNFVPFHTIGDLASFPTSSTQLTGTRTFNGAAVGMFAHTADDRYYSGRFKARASFIIDYDFDGTAGEDPITATIDQFVDVDGNAPISHWQVDLPSPAALSGNNLSASGTDASWSGRWAGNNGGYPRVIVGTFSADLEDGRARGAFGLRNQ